VLVLLVLETRTHRFAELRRAVGGVSERMLAQTLQWLEGDGWCCARPSTWCRPMWSTA
jgi:DNA-binding HxlR family transcriptional regulator